MNQEKRLRLQIIELALNVSDEALRTARLKSGAYNEIFNELVRMESSIKKIRNLIEKESKG